MEVARCGKGLRDRKREISRVEKSCETHTGCHRTWSRTLESLANPLESLRVRLQATLRSVAERASELGVLLVKHSKPGSAHASQQMVLLLGLNRLSIDVLLASY